MKQVVERAAEAVGLVKPDGVGLVHLLRHSGAIARLRATGDPRSVQAQLGHSSPEMTMRYWRTVTVDEGIAVQASVDLEAE